MDLETQLAIEHLAAELAEVEEVPPISAEQLSRLKAIFGPLGTVQNPRSAA